MAKATKQVKVIEATVVTLEMSIEEARTLVDILRKVGGHPEESRRGVADKIYHALSNVNVHPTATFPEDVTGNIMFQKVL